jgi:transposase
MVVDRERVEQMVSRAKVVLTGEDFGLLCALVQTVDWYTEQLARKDAKLAEMRYAVFGGKSEKTKNVKGRRDDAAGQPKPEDGQANDGQELANTQQDSTEPRAKTAPEAKPKAKGKREKGRSHGRNGAADFPGANKISVTHPDLRPGDVCPKACAGRLGRYKPSPHLYLFGQAPIGANFYELEQLRCGACGAIFTAPAPEPAQGKKHDESVPATIAMLRYGAGLPHNRLAKLQQAVGIPLPASTQWDLINEHIDALVPVFEALVRVAAQGKLVHNDDTGMTVLDLVEQIQAELAAAAKKDDVRTGIFTTGVISRNDGRDIALFCTGRQHAGENLCDVLQHRDPNLSPVMQMCDGLDRNLPKDLKTIVSNCLGHGRRNFVKVADNFPTECLHVLDELALVYKVDALARKQKLDPDERLGLHQQQSTPVMDRLKQWMQEQLETKKVEPNSGLGQAINYMLKRWDRLTLFLRMPGAALDNNVVERALKRAILHRKNSLFYRTERGAFAGDLFMSLIHTAELNGVDPLAYLTTLMRHDREIRDNPEQWLPWAYLTTLAGQAAA